MRLINANALLDALQELRFKQNSETYFFDDLWIRYNSVVKIIQEQPDVQFGVAQNNAELEKENFMVLKIDPVSGKNSVKFFNTWEWVMKYLNFDKGYHHQVYVYNEYYNEFKRAL